MTLQMYTFDFSFLNSLRCISQRIKQTLKVSFLGKLEMES